MTLLPSQSSNIMLIALGRVFPLLQGLGGYTRGCALTRPHGKSFTNSRDKTPNKQAKGTLRQKNEDFIAFLQTKITKGHWLEAVEKYKRIATCVAIFLILGRSKRR